MKYFLFLFLVLNSLTTTAQNSNEIDGSLSEIGFYTMNTPLTETTIKKELKKVFPDIKFVDDAPEKIDGTMAYMEAITDVAEVYPAHDMEYLAYFAEGFSKEQKEQLQTSKNAFILVLYYQKKDVFTHSKKLFDWVYKKIKDTDYVVYDGEVREYFSPKTWKRDRVDAWENGIPSAINQLTIHSYRKDEYCRSITFGMQRFGLPDLIIDDSPCTNVTSVNQLLTIMGQLLLEGNKVQEKELFIDLEAIQNTILKNLISEIVYENAEKKATINFDTNVLQEEGDPFNLLYEVNFENDAYKNPQAYENEVFAKLFGSEDEITHIKHNEEILAASERAKKHLPALQKLFNNGLDQSSLLLKAPFTTDSGGNEWMWIEVTKWDDETIEGILQNDPYYIKDLKSGAKVTVQQADVFDYILYKADGSSEGNETGKLIQKYGN
ncbi:DUF2314 domain-containing protein [Kordia algicida OT-1]|uniref:DUF2314 domain-containing protein n=1 Tax=Kordia algicida OT-1 TaxID=391587 RepID=A9EDJ9_9FLAO|nr:DUF2314 domain-containing protein [Kordia algicida]EDP94242.1 hypothetical protein KAOT1_00840 [Kordia algicida OT-1]